MSSNNGSFSSKPRRGRGGWGRQVAGSLLVADKGQTDSTHMAATGGDEGQTDTTNMGTNGGNLSEATQAPANDPPATTTTRKGNGKKQWAKVKLIDIAPMAGPSYPPVQTKGKPQPPFAPRRHEGPHRGVNVDGECLSDIADRAMRLKLEEANKPLTDFTKFPDLAAEMRFKIWNLAARAEARILELVIRPDFLHLPYEASDYHEDPNPNDLMYYNHRIFEVSTQGQVVPGVIQASRESRQEAKLVFEKRYINSYPSNYPFRKNDERPWTWYNPFNDIIFFGEGTCIRTVVDFFNRTGKANEKYPKIAFRAGNMIGTCKSRCDFDTWDMMTGTDDEYACAVGVGIGGGGVGILGVLHGKPEKIALNTMVPGAPDVKEVFFVVKTECMKYEAGVMPSNLTFRPAIHNGLTTGQEKMKTSLEGSINEIRLGMGVPGCGQNRWDSGNYPDFKFVSLAPPLKNGRGKNLKHDAIMIPTQDIGKLIYRNSEFLYDLGIKARVDIIPSEKAYIGQKNREIGLYNGTEEGIAKAKEEIKKQLLLDFEAVRGGPNHQRRGGRGGFRGRGGSGGRGQ